MATAELTPRYATLYEITGDMAALCALLEETGGEVTPEIEEWMAEYGDALAAKADRVAEAIRQHEANAKSFKAERDWFQAKAHTAENSVAAIKRMVLAVMETRGEVEFKGARFRLCMTPNGGAAPRPQLRVPEEQLPPRFTREVTTRLVDYDALAAALADGDPEAAAVAELVPRGYHLRIR